MKHQITRIRHEVRRRELTVRRVEHLTPRMLRLILTGDELKGFSSSGPDDHIKVFASGADGQVELRDYTPRRYDAAANELTIDFALHDAGPATAWARSVQPGDSAEIAGPKGSVVLPYDFDWWLFIGDETALPAIGRRIEEIPPGTHVTSVVAVTGREEEQHFVTQAEHQAIWVHRPASRADDPAPLLQALEGYALPAGEGFVWLAAEASVAKTLRRHILENMRHPPQWLKAAGYWLKGKADAKETLEPA